MSEDGIWPILADVTSLRVLAATIGLLITPRGFRHYRHAVLVNFHSSWLHHFHFACLSKTAEHIGPGLPGHLYGATVQGHYTAHPLSLHITFPPTSQITAPRPKMVIL